MGSWRGLAAVPPDVEMLEVTPSRGPFSRPLLSVLWEGGCVVVVPGLCHTSSSLLRMDSLTWGPWDPTSLWLELGKSVSTAGETAGLF